MDPVRRRLEEAVAQARAALAVGLEVPVELLGAAEAVLETPGRVDAGRYLVSTRRPPITFDADPV